MKRVQGIFYFTFSVKFLNGNLQCLFMICCIFYNHKWSFRQCSKISNVSFSYSLSSSVSPSFRSHHGLLDGVLAPQPDPSPNDGCCAKVPLDPLLLPQLRHSPPRGRHLLLPELGHQSILVQPVLQTVQGGFCPSAAVPPHHWTHQQTQCSNLACFVFALLPAPDKIFEAQ